MFERLADRLRLDRLPASLLQLDHLRVGIQRYRRGSDVATHFKKALDALPATVKHCVAVVVEAHKARGSRPASHDKDAAAAARRP